MLGKAIVLTLIALVISGISLPIYGNYAENERSSIREVVVVDKYYDNGTHRCTVAEVNSNSTETFTYPYDWGYGCIADEGDHLMARLLIGEGKAKHI